MGMSASQARLLSITSRLTNNEFRAQTITNSKLRLATETTQATKAYNEALDAEQFMFLNYDDNGDATKISLTPALMYEYAPMKNQYTLLNTGGKILVPALEAKNYEETATLADFLARYDLVDKIEGSPRTVKEPNPEYAEWEKWYDEWKAEEPDKTDEIYWEDVPGSGSSELYDSFLWATSICYSCSMSYFTHELGLPGDTIYDSKGNEVLKYWYDNSNDYFTVYMDDGSGNSYTEYHDHGDITDNGKICYCHVLSHLLKPKSYITSTGKEISILSNDGSEYGHWWHLSSNYNNRSTRAEELADDIAKNDYKCCAEDAIDITASSSDVEKLMSDYYIDENGDFQTKSLIQKIVDLDYLNKECPDVTAQQLYDAIQHFVNHDLNILKEPEKKFKEKEYDDDWNDWNSEYKEPPDKYKERTEYGAVMAVINDQDKAQWYTNLWYKMNGSESANLVRNKSIQTDENTFKNIFTVDGAPKNEHGGEYQIFDPNLFEDAKWLQSALEMGVISMTHATFEKPCEDDGRLLELSSDAIYWNSKIYTDATDIVAVPDDEAVAKAQVEYKKAMKRIHAEDKKLDTDLRKLDTEHSALQAEYDSIKETISKNVERSFKMFS